MGGVGSNPVDPDSGSIPYELEQETWARVEAVNRSCRANRCAHYALKHVAIARRDSIMHGLRRCPDALLLCFAPLPLILLYRFRHWVQGMPPLDKAEFWMVARSGVDNARASLGCFAMQPQDYKRVKPLFQIERAALHSYGPDAYSC